MSYAPDHADALADIKGAGGLAVTFTREVVAHNATTGHVDSSSSASVAGYAIRTRGNPHRYRDLSLVESQSPTLLFVANKYGDAPEPGDTLTWYGAKYTARDVDLVAVDGMPLLARVVIAR